MGVKVLLGTSDALLSADWDFDGTSHYSQLLTHDFHPYPAKFPPVIPGNLLSRLAQDGMVVLDPFCGSGTTLVEAGAIGCRPIGVDTNPVAALVARVKSSPVPPTDTDIDRLVTNAASRAARYYSYGSFDHHYVRTANQCAGPRFRGVEFWFSRDAQLELTAIREAVELEEGLLRDQALAAMSAITVRVSLQDSDTRYVRRQKSFSPLDPIGWFKSRLIRLQQGLNELRSLGAATPLVFTADARRLSELGLPAVDLVITSSPYPNAFSYHLYHQLRAIWLGIKVEGLRKDEIGNHRDYSRSNGADEDTFLADMTKVLSGIRDVSRPGAIAVFVIGNSTIRGTLIDNVALLKLAAERADLTWIGERKRLIASTRKSFNPQIGKIKTEHLCLMSIE